MRDADGLAGPGISGPAAGRPGARAWRQRLGRAAASRSVAGSLLARQRLEQPAVVFAVARWRGCRRCGGAGGTLAQPPECPRRTPASARVAIRSLDIKDFLVQGRVRTDAPIVRDIRPRASHALCRLVPQHSQILVQSWSSAQQVREIVVQHAAQLSEAARIDLHASPGARRPCRPVGPSPAARPR